MVAPVKEKVRVDDAAFEDEGELTREEERQSFLRSMQQAARGEGQPAREFMEELRREMEAEGLRVSDDD